MVLLGDHLYFGHDQNQGYPVCVEFKTGEIKWGPEKKGTAGGSGSAATLYADGRLYYRNEGGPFMLVEANPKKYVECGRFEQPDRSDHPAWPHPVIANGNLYIRDQDVLLCYDVKAK